MNRKAVLILVLCAILASISGILIKEMKSMSPSSIAGLRMSLPVIIIGFWLKSQGVKIFRINTGKMLAASALNAVRLYLYLVAFIFTSIGNATILFYTYPIFTAILGYIFLKEKLKLQQWIFLFIAFTGLIIAYFDKPMNFEDADFVGMLAALISGAIYAGVVVIFKSQSQNYSSTEMVFHQNFVGLFCFLPFFIIEFPVIETRDIGICLFYTFLIGFVVFKLFFMGLHYLKASIASSIMYLEIVSAIVLSYLFLGEQLSVNMVIGGSLIVISSFMINRVR